MLGWLGAAAAPLLIHLWSRRKFREVPWAAVAFLMAAMRKNARRMQLQQWLLLAVRTLLIVLVVLAVAEPFDERLSAGVGSATAHKIIVLDCSYSMAYRPEASTLFARTQQLAAQLVQESGSNDGFTLIDMSRSPKMLLGPATSDRGEVANQIESLPPTQAGADLPATLTIVEEASKTAQSLRFDRQEVYFFTDLQRATWSAAAASQEAPANTNATSNNLRDQIVVLAQKAKLFVVDVGQSRANNLAVTRLATTDTFATLGREIAFEATIHQFGDQPRSNVKVELLIDDVPVGEQTVTVPAGGDAAVRFTHRFRTAGEHVATVRASGDQLEVDNTRWLTLPVKEHVRVLCVAGKQDAAKYIASALDPNPSDASAIQPVVISEGDLAEQQLQNFDAIFVCNVAQLSANEAERLARYAAAGGGVIFFLGDRVIPERYNALAAGVEPLLPARLGEVITAPRQGLDPLDYRHPIVAPFRGRERAGLLTTPVARYFQLDLSNSKTNTETALATSAGNPFIVAAPLGRGRTIVVATDASLSSIDPTSGEPWTNWPTWPSFLPMIRELLAYAASGAQSQGEPLVGMPLVSTLSTRPSGDVISVTRPDGTTDSASVTSSPTGWQWAYDRTNVSGIYQATGPSSAESQPFAVNVDTREGNLTKADAKQLPPELLVRDTWQNATSAATSGGLLSHSGWHRSLLWCALALLFAESLLAWRFGRGIL